MTGLRFPAPMYADFAAGLLADQGRETCGVIYTQSAGPAGAWLAAAAELVPEAAYEKRDLLSAVLKPAFLVEVANRARREKVGVVLAHSHPGTAGHPDFSSIDDAGERELADYFAHRVPDASHFALLATAHGCRARPLGGRGAAPVWEIGPMLRCLAGDAPSLALSQAHDRQIRAFGRLGQAALKRLRVGVVGAGGTGSVVIQQLAHLGVTDLTIVEPDCVETTNLNRLVGARRDDVAVAKADVARRTFLGVNPDAQITLRRRDVVDSDVATELAALDFLFLCTDSHASRAVVGQLAYQYYVPCIDMGVSITVRDGVVTHLVGRVQMLAPGLPCLVCTNALDSEQIRREMLTPEQRALDPYLLGAHEPQPAVISLNSTMASLAITMFLGAVTPAPAQARFQLYDGIRGTVRPTAARCDPACIVCSPTGALGKGASWSLPTRPVEQRPVEQRPVEHAHV